MAVDAMSVNSLPWMRVFVEPYITLSPAPPSPANRLPVSDMSLDAVNDTFASGWVNAPHVQVALHVGEPGRGRWRVPGGVGELQPAERHVVQGAGQRAGALQQ